jgi:Undecaprenyl-phosphate galactose phosphotransferase WbaP
LHAIRPEQAPLLARAYNVPYAIMAMPDLSYAERAQMIGHIGKFFRRLYVVPERAGAALWTAQSSQGLMGVAVKHVYWSRAARRIKRFADVCGAALGLLVTAPLIAAIAALIKLDAPGPVFFRQERMGLGGRCFEVLKFRTMHTDAEAKLQAILDADPERRAQYEQYHKLDDDPRVTRIGAWLRRFSLDELPQLWNVLWGDMSLVGPRAYMPGELPKMNGLSRPVLQCPPGLTGLWQVSGRNNLDFSTRVDLDVHYMQNWTVWLDIYIALRTLPVVLTGEGAK